MPDPKQRFSDRVEAYRKYRPSYPDEAIDALLAATRPSSIAEVGSGTGIFTRLLLERGQTVQAIEPNEPMRRAAESDLQQYPHFQSHAGSAEATGLTDTSVDLVVAAQAYHWFEPQKAKAEFRRILRPKGQVALVWNKRLADTTPFLRDYETLLAEHGLDYTKVNHANLSLSDIESFFSPNPVKLLTFPNQQRFDYAGLVGRCLSSSYVPAVGHPQHRPFFTRLEALFQRHQADGQVAFDYSTQLFVGSFT